MYVGAVGRKCDFEALGLTLEQRLMLENVEFEVLGLTLEQRLMLPRLRTHQKLRLRKRLGGCRGAHHGALTPP